MKDSHTLANKPENLFEWVAMLCDRIVYLACDFVPGDERLDDSCAELIEAMDEPEGLILCPCIAPVIGLDRGKCSGSA